MSAPNLIKENTLFLAPMAGVTDMAYRILMKELGADVVCSELISAEAYVHKSKRTIEMLKVHQTEQPAGIQIFGSNPNSMAEIAAYAEQQGAHFVDINFGCPVPKVTKNGAGSAMLKKPEQMDILLKKVRAAIKIPLSIKIRTGWDNESKNAKEIIDIAYNNGIDWVTIHGRTREMGYSGDVEWAFLEEIKKVAPLPIIGNGDLWTPEEALKKLENFTAVMVGRPILGNPLFFLQTKQIRDDSTEELPSIPEICQRYYELVEEHCHPKVKEIKLIKLFIWFSTGYQKKAAFRKSMYENKGSCKELLDRTLDYFSTAERSTEAYNLNFIDKGHG